MDQVPAGETSSAVSSHDVLARRRRMRAQARGLRPAAPPESDVFQTPQWLERSFVLPLTEPERSDVPNQPVPHHDDYEDEPIDRPEPESEDESTPTFVRPPTREIDFARVINRADMSRTATRAALSSTAVTGVVLVVYLLVRSQIVLGMALSFAMIAVVAAGVRLRLATASIPHLDH
ncbi:MAG: hypothetical protein ABIR34_04080 [Marmoricola sp.]